MIRVLESVRNLILIEIMIKNTYMCPEWTIEEKCLIGERLGFVGKDVQILDTQT